MADDAGLIRQGSPPSSSGMGGGTGINQKMAGLPMWAWIAIAAAGGIVFFVWKSRSNSSPDTSAATSTDTGGEIDPAQLNTIYAQIRDLQGQVSDGQDNTPAPTASNGPGLKAPTGLKTVRVDRGGAALQWDKVDGAVGYRLYANGKQVGDTVAFSNGYIYLPKKNTQYTVGVAAVGPAGLTTGPTATISVKTKA